MDTERKYLTNHCLFIYLQTSRNKNDGLKNMLYNISLNLDFI